MVIILLRDAASVRAVARALENLDCRLSTLLRLIRELKEGTAMVSSMAAMMMTTMSSIRVKPRSLLDCPITMRLSLWLTYQEPAYSKSTVKQAGWLVIGVWIKGLEVRQAALK